MSEDRKIVVLEFFGELDVGIFENKIFVVLNVVVLGVLNNGGKGKVIIEFDLFCMSNLMEEKCVMIFYKFKFIILIFCGKFFEEDMIEMFMYVGKGGKLVIMQEDQGQLFIIKGDVDGKLKIVN